jgi:hypothetical protein
LLFGSEVLDAFALSKISSNLPKDYTDRFKELKESLYISDLIKKNNDYSNLLYYQLH